MTYSRKLDVTEVLTDEWFANLSLPPMPIRIRKHFYQITVTYHLRMRVLLAVKFPQFFSNSHCKFSVKLSQFSKTHYQLLQPCIFLHELRWSVYITNVTWHTHTQLKTSRVQLSSNGNGTVRWSVKGGWTADVGVAPRDQHPDMCSSEHHTSASEHTNSYTTTTTTTILRPPALCPGLLR